MLNQPTTTLIFPNYLGVCKANASSVSLGTIEALETTGTMGTMGIRTMEMERLLKET